MVDVVVSGAARAGDYVLHDDEMSDFTASVKSAVYFALLDSYQKISLVPSGTGIALLTFTGERWPIRWSNIVQSGKRVRPKQYGTIIHNGAAGRCSIDFGLTGPQLAIVDGDVVQAAETMVDAGYANAMVVVAYEEGSGYPAQAMVLEPAPAARPRARWLTLDYIRLRMGLRAVIYGTGSLEWFSDIYSVAKGGLTL